MWANRALPISPFVNGESVAVGGRVQFHFLKNLVSYSPFFGSRMIETGYGYHSDDGFYGWFTEFTGWSVGEVSCPQESVRGGYHIDISPTQRQCWGSGLDPWLLPDGAQHYYRHINLFGQWGAQACGATNPGPSSTGCMNIGQAPNDGYNIVDEDTVLFESNGSVGGPVNTFDIMKGNFISLERWDDTINNFREVYNANAAVAGYFTNGVFYRGWPSGSHTTLCPPWGIEDNVFGVDHWFVVGNWSNTSCIPDGTPLW